MWPMRYETMTRDECRKCLRCLELEAYGSMVSVLRAQGPFTNEKQKLLQELAKVLHISNERHRAEVRRAVNDEKLATIAEQLSGPNTGTDWTIEGRRVIPLLPRLKARSAFATLANSLSLAATAANRRNLPLHKEKEDAKDIKNESPIKVKVQENSCNDHELVPNEDNLNDQKVFTEIKESARNKEVNSQSNTANVTNRCPLSEKRKSTSPLSPVLSNKILVMPSSSLGSVNLNSTDKRPPESTVHLSQMPINTLQHQNVTIIPLNINLRENIPDPNNLEMQECANNHSGVSPENILSTMTTGDASVLKMKGRIITTQSKINTKIQPAILMSNNVPNMSCTSENKSPDTQDTSTKNSLNSKLLPKSQNLQKVINSENSNSLASCTKCVVPVIHSNVKTPICKTIISGNSQRLMAVCPVTTVSNGPGPPQAKQITSLTYKKLHTAFNNETTAKMGVALNSNKTVNMSHHTDAKLGSKTNVILIQKGQSKGVTLSHAGKEVLGKVIMGGKSLCVTNQHNTSISVLPRHITLNNGDQAVTMLSTTNTSHIESATPSVKSGNTVMVNLRQDVLDKTKALSHDFEPTNVQRTESKTVIQSMNVCLSKEPRNSDAHLHVQNQERIVKTDSTITTTKHEKHRSV